ncbi:hypothetical protein HAX54_023796 [Datura stramonium]|uniref:Dynamin stalk domain-containing protein n=1 Tax=Datura stramonium TaxID=4076 RepID=A0ABS8UX10_DATST|nr:hypothetical protein [Datura stramonium]
MITNLIDMEMDYINSSHPNFIGGTKAVDMAQPRVEGQQVGRPQPDNDRAYCAEESKTLKRGRLEFSFGPGFGTWERGLEATMWRSISTTRTWGVTSLFGIRGSSVGNSSKRHAAEVVHDIDQAPPIIQ